MKNPHLYAIAKHEPRSAEKAKRTPISNSVAIHQWWIGKLPQAEIPNVLSQLTRIREDEVWVVCDCTEDHKNPPLFTVAFRKHKDSTGKTGTIYLSRMAGRGEHHIHCDFRLDMRETDPEQKPRVSQGSNPVPITQPTYLEEDQPTELGNPKRKPSKSKNSASGSGSTRQDPLARQLFWLLHKADMQSWPLKGSTPAAMLLEVAKTMPLKNGISLSNIMFCNSEAWTSQWVNRAFTVCETAGLPKQAVLVCPITAASKEDGWVQFQDGGDKFQVSGQIKASDDTSAARYPMLMYAKVMRPRDGDARIAKAYLHPISSVKHWMAVDSGYERDALQIIQDACLILGSKNVQCTIDKPVYDWGETCARPDFVIHGSAGGKSHSMMVETMGISDPEYVERKKDTIAKLSGYKVFEDMRHMQGKVVDQNLRNFILAHMLGNLSPPSTPLL